MIPDVQDLVCQILFMGNLPQRMQKNWSHFENGDSHSLIIQVDKTRVKGSRVCKLWHKHFRAWLDKEIEAEAKRSWVRCIKMAMTMCNYVDFSFDFGDERAQYSLWIKDEPLIVVDFKCREGKGKNKKGLCEVVAKYGILAKYRHMHGVKKTIAKKQAKQIKKKIIGVPNEAFLLLNNRSPEEKAKLSVWRNTMRNELLEWFGEQHARMRAAF